MKTIIPKIIVATGLVYFFTSPGVFSQEIIPIETTNNALVLEVNEKDELGVSYFGKKLENTHEYGEIAGMYNQGDDYSTVLNSAYTPAGSKNLAEPAITVEHADGNTSLNLKYAGHEIKNETKDIKLTKITLKDPVYSFQVSLFYKVFEKYDVIETWTEIVHQEADDVVLKKAASANLYLKGKDFWLTHFHGDWAKEMQPEEEKITHGIKTLDSKLGTRANLFRPSTFMISEGAPAKEDEGTVMFGTLEWSGNFRVDLELDPLNNLRVIAGINDYNSAFKLKPGEIFKTPKFLFLLSHNGKGEASRKLHSWARNHKILNGNGDRMTLLNNWEATYFDFNENKLLSLIEDAQDLGVDLFLLDDGWFGNKYPRNDDTAGLGDWEVNEKKLPNGIGTLVKKASDEDIKFGIWIEPEMVNPDSELYHKHPDWVINQPGRDEHYFRNQLVLDLSNPEVQDFVFGVVDELFSENPNLAYMKWDCNSVIYNAHSDYLEDQSHLYIEYVKGLYNVLDRVREKYPRVPMMLCSGGGGRVDYKALEYFTEFWQSDNTDALERVFMQWEYSYFYPSISVANHVTEWGDQSLKYRTDVAMMGKLGFDIVVSELSPEDFEFSQNAVETYNRIKGDVWYGDLYRLADPKTHDVASLMYVGEDQETAVMFNYLVNNRYDKKSTVPVKLKGLDACKEYFVTEINLYPGEKSALKGEKIYSGEFLMTIGVNPGVSENRKSVVLRIEAVR